MAKTLKDTLIEGLNPRKPEDYDVVLGKGNGERLAKHYENSQGTVVNDLNYLIGEAIVESTYGEDLNKRNMKFVCSTVKNYSDEYKKTSAVGRFFSYLNPFPNKYRDMRNQISEAKNFLFDKGIDLTTFNAYLDDKIESKDVKFEAEGNNKELLYILQATEDKSAGNIIAGNDVDRNINEYMKASILKRFIKGEKINPSAEKQFAKDVNTIVDKAQFWIEPTEYDYDLFEKQKQGEKELKSLFAKHDGLSVREPVDGLENDVKEQEQNVEFNEQEKSVEKVVSVEK